MTQSCAEGARRPATVAELAFRPGARSTPSCTRAGLVMHYDLGFIDLEQKTSQPLDNPFGPGLPPMS